MTGFAATPSSAHPVDDLRARVALSSLIGPRVPLRRQADLWRGDCPFHPADDGRSFWVDDRQGIYRCFVCSAHGDAVRWLMNGEGLSLDAAVARLAELARSPEPSEVSGEVPPGPCEPPGFVWDRATRHQVSATMTEISNLVAYRDYDEIGAFLDLALRIGGTTPLGQRLVVPLDPRSSGAADVLARAEALGPELVEEWEGWSARFDALIERNPRLALAQAIGEVDLYNGRLSRARRGLAAW